MIGFGDGTFRPGTDTSRAMIVTILWRLEGKPVVNYAMTFEEVGAESWYAEAVRWAQASGVVEGYSDASFGPNDAITREQLAAILWRYCHYKGYDVSVGEDTDILSCADASEVSGWAVPAMKWAYGTALIQGVPGQNGEMYLAPDGSAVRAQSATIFYRFCSVIAEN